MSATPQLNCVPSCFGSSDAARMCVAAQEHVGREPERFSGAEREHLAADLDFRAAEESCSQRRGHGGILDQAASTGHREGSRITPG